MKRVEKSREWEERVVRFKESGQKMAKWCAAHGIKENSLRYWIQKLDPVETVSFEWMAVEVDEHIDPSKNSLVVNVGQTTIEVTPGFNPALFADVVRILKTLC